MLEVSVASATFLTRKLAVLSGEVADCKIYCDVCDSKVSLVARKKLFEFACSHYEQCKECSEYQIEKIYRCEPCRSGLSNTKIEFCGTDCVRHISDQATTTQCTLCDSFMQKECRSCKKYDEYRSVKRDLKGKIFIFVRSPADIPIDKNRPCSHYALCNQCKSVITKGHRGRSMCGPCKLAVKIPSVQQKFLTKDNQREFVPVQFRTPETTYPVLVDTNMCEVATYVILTQTPSPYQGPLLTLFGKSRAIRDRES